MRKGIVTADLEATVRVQVQGLGGREEDVEALIYHDFAFVLPHGRHARSSLSDWSLDRWRTGEQFTIPPSTWVFRAGAVHFCENYVIGEDPEFLQRRWNDLHTVHLPEVLSRYYVHGDSLSHRAMCRVVAGQLRGVSVGAVGGGCDIAAPAPAGTGNGEIAAG